MKQEFHLKEFIDLRKNYTRNKQKINSLLLKKHDSPEWSSYKQDLIDLGDELDNKYDEYYYLTYKRE